MRFIFALLLIVIASCNNGRGLRMSNRNNCNPDIDQAAYELTENEATIFELSSETFTGGDTFSSPTFRLTKYINDKQFSYVTLNLASGILNLNNTCVGNFIAGEPGQIGSDTFEIAFLSPEGNVQIGGAQIDFDADKPEGLTPVFTTSNLTNEPVTPATPDILTQLSLLGFQTQVFTYIQGDRRNQEFIIHARNISEETFARITVIKDTDPE